MEHSTTVITCPRCGTAATVRFYGPCDPCRQELGTTMRIDAPEPADPERTRYEPKLNVVPNQVATKD